NRHRRDVLVESFGVGPQFPAHTGVVDPIQELRGRTPAPTGWFKHDHMASVMGKHHALRESGPDAAAGGVRAGGATRPAPSRPGGGRGAEPLKLCAHSGPTTIVLRLPHAAR